MDDKTRALIEDAFASGWGANATYNDTSVNDFDEEWGKWCAANAAALAAALTTQKYPNDAAFEAYLQECDRCAIQPDVAGAFHAGWTAAPTPPEQADAINAAYEMGWRMAAEWANRDDLHADIGSLAYIQARDAAIGDPK